MAKFGIFSTYKVRIMNHGRSVAPEMRCRINGKLQTLASTPVNAGESFRQMTKIYRKLVDFYIAVFLDRWEKDFASCKTNNDYYNRLREITSVTDAHPNPPFDVTRIAGDVIAELRGAAGAEALGDVKSYMSRLENWKKAPVGQAPGLPRAGRTYPTIYATAFKFSPEITIKVGGKDVTIRNKGFIRSIVNGQWRWIELNLRKSDMVYIARHCGMSEQKCPTLRRRRSRWFLDFGFADKVDIPKKEAATQTILAVQLGLSKAAVVCAMTSDGKILGRRFLHLRELEAKLNRSLGRQNDARRMSSCFGKRGFRMPRLCSRTDGLNARIAVLTAEFIMKCAQEFNVDTVVFGKIDKTGRKLHPKQRLHFWRAAYVQEMVEHKAHKALRRISRVNLANTKALAFDGSGKVDSIPTDPPEYIKVKVWNKKTKTAEIVKRHLNSANICRFQTGKEYAIDLNAAYNIGARFFVREIYKTLKSRQQRNVSALVPECEKRSTVTLNSLRRMGQVLKSEGV